MISLSPLYIILAIIYHLPTPYRLFPFIYFIFFSFYFFQQPTDHHTSLRTDPTFFFISPFNTLDQSVCPSIYFLFALPVPSRSQASQNTLVNNPRNNDLPLKIRYSCFYLTSLIFCFFIFISITMIYFLRTLSRSHHHLPSMPRVVTLVSFIIYSSVLSFPFYYHYNFFFH